MKKFKIAIIGGGVVGGMLAYRMSKYQNSLVILEKENDVATGQSKANSGIVHAGYDPAPGSLKARLNVRGSEMMEETCRNLQVKYKKNGTLVVGYDENDMVALSKLLERGKANGVKNLQLIDGITVRKMEKNLSKEIVGALYAPTGAIVCPYELTIHSVGHAMDYGAELMTNFKVTGISENDENAEAAFGYLITSEDGETIFAETVVNCAGLYSHEIAGMVCDHSFNIVPRKGEYHLLDKDAGDLITMTIFRTPTKMGKGVLAVKTVDGNILLGPTSEDIEDKDDKSVTAKGLSSITKKEEEFFENVPMNKVITQFAGLRAHGDKGDFIINFAGKNFINAAGIESPGLSSAPAIAEMIEEMLFSTGSLCRDIKENWNPQRKKGINFKELTLEQKNQIIKDEPAYGRVICRCEEITEGEILAEIRRNPPARDVDGVKRRTRTGMGRCQGGFCMPSVVEILSKELGVQPEEISKKGKGSEILMGRTKGNPEMEKQVKGGSNS